MYFVPKVSIVAFAISLASHMVNVSGISGSGVGLSTTTVPYRVRYDRIVEYRDAYAAIIEISHVTITIVSISDCASEAKRLVSALSLLCD
jgi:hypothetical protein